MTKTVRYLTVTTLAAGLAAGLGWSKGKPGGGGPGGGDTSTIPVIAQFNANGHLTGDNNNGPYAGSSVPGGRVELPATGNFTMDLKGTGRVLNIDWSNYIPGSGAAPTNLPNQPEVFISINRHCLADDLNIDGSCSDFAATEGSLTALEQDGTTLLLGVHMTFANPDSRKASYWVKCGASGGDAPDMFQEGTDLVKATCELADTNGCAQWSLTPATADGSLVCSLLEKTNRSLDRLADYNLSFDLTLERDQP